MESQAALTRIKVSTRTNNQTRTSAEHLSIHRLGLSLRLILQMDAIVRRSSCSMAVTLHSILTPIDLVYAYTDAACTENQITVPVGIENCYNSTAAGLSSYEIVCTS